MIAGLPGTGLGGIFYLLAALVVILREGWGWVRGDTSQRGFRFVLRLSVMTCLILLVLVGTYWLLDSVLALTAPAADAPSANVTTHAVTTFHLPPFLIATLPVQIAILVMILGGVEVASAFHRRAALKRKTHEQADTTKI